MTRNSRTELPTWEPDAAHLDRLHDRLVRAADRDGLLDIAYRIVDSPIGSLLLAATPVGLVRIAFEAEGSDEVLASLAATVSPRLLDAPARLDDAARQVGEYLDGKRQTFDLDLDWRLATGFRRAVLGYLPTIAYGHTASYQAVAVGVQNPKAVRAVGTACATNPLPLVVPCHRVVRSDGTAGAYRGGAATKQRLLAMEAR